MTETLNDQMTQLAVSAALLAIREGDHRNLKVTLTFDAKRDPLGVAISHVSLGYTVHRVSHQAPSVSRRGVRRD